jgi:hypothetical protein
MLGGGGVNGKNNQILSELIQPGRISRWPPARSSDARAVIIEYHNGMKTIFVPISPATAGPKEPSFDREMSERSGVSRRRK